MLTKPRWLLQAEGAAILLVTLILYAQDHFHWWLYALLFLAPDLSMLGYVVNVRVGAAMYNLAHTLTVPLTLLAVGLLLPAGFSLRANLVVAHWLRPHARLRLEISHSF